MTAKRKETKQAAAAADQERLRRELGLPTGVGFDGKPPLIEQSLRDATGEKEVRYTNVNADPLILMLRKGALQHHHWLAAERFRSDFNKVCHAGMRCAGFEPMVDHGVTDFPISVFEAGIRLAELKSVPGIAVVGYKLIEQVCGNGYSLRALRKTGWTQSIGYLAERLREALDGAAVYYKIQTDTKATRGGKPRKIRMASGNLTASGTREWDSGGHDVKPPAFKTRGESSRGIVR